MQNTQVLEKLIKARAAQIARLQAELLKLQELLAKLQDLP